MKKDYSRVENILTSKLNEMIEKTEKPVVHLRKIKNGRKYHFSCPHNMINETWFHHERLNDCINDYIDRGFIVQIEDRI